MQQSASVRAFDKPLRFAALVLAGAVSAVLLSPSAARAQGYADVAYSGYADWQGYGQDACLVRARQGIDMVRQAFGLAERGPANAPGISVAVDAGHTMAMVHCLGDLETSDRRSLVVIGVHTSRLGTDPQILAMLRECMFGGRCGSSAQAAQGTVPRPGSPAAAGLPTMPNAGVPPPGPPASAFLQWPRPGQSAGATGQPPTTPFGQAPVSVAGLAAQAVPTAATGAECPPWTALVALQLWWSDPRGDNMLAAIPGSVNAASASGYGFARNEGYVYNQQFPGTVPLVRYWHEGRGDNFTTANPTGHAEARNAGYVPVATEGYVFEQQQCGAVPLVNWWSDQRGDNFATATDSGARDAQAAGYGRAWTEGYIIPLGGQGAAPTMPAPSAVDLAGLAQRFAAAHGRLQTAAFADLYADMSVLLGTYGKTVGWVEGYDANAPQGPGGPDTGRANLDRNAHHGYVMGTGGAAAGEYVRMRMVDLQQKLAPQVAADLARRADELLRRFGM